MVLPKEGLFEGGREIITTLLSCGDSSSSISVKLLLKVEDEEEEWREGRTMRMVITRLPSMAESLWYDKRNTTKEMLWYDRKRNK